MADQPKTNESRIRNAGLRMALKLIPSDLMQQAPATLERYLADQLLEVSPHLNESGACYLISPDDRTGALRLMLVTLDEECRVSRIIKEMTIAELFNKILDGIKEL